MLESLGSKWNDNEKRIQNEENHGYEWIHKWYKLGYDLWKHEIPTFNGNKAKAIKRHTFFVDFKSYDIIYWSWSFELDLVMSLYRD